MIRSFLLLFLAFAVSCFGQAQQFFALGVGANSVQSPEPSGWGVYAVKVAPKVLSYSQATWVSTKPTTVETGIATIVAQGSQVTLLALGTAGGGFGEGNAGVAFSGGGAAHIRIRGDLGVLLGIRAQDSTITTVRPVFHVGLCWGPALK